MNDGQQDPKLADLIELKTKLSDRLREIDRQIQASQATNEGGEAGAIADRIYAKQRPVRAAVLDVLYDFGFPAYTRQITLYCRARYGRDIPPTRFGSLTKDEMEAHLAGKRAQSVWLAFCLTHDRGEPIKRLLGRSDWPLAERIVAPTTGRVQHLKMTARLSELAGRGDADDQTMMGIIAADHARDLPGVQVKRGVFELARWRDVALAELEHLEPIDRERREEAAARWSKILRSPHHVLFGAPELVEGDRLAKLKGRNVK